jgi:hypothetical protein
MNAGGPDRDVDLYYVMYAHDGQDATGFIFAK